MKLSKKMLPLILTASIMILVSGVAFATQEEECGDEVDQKPCSEVTLKDSSVAATVAATGGGSGTYGGRDEHGDPRKGYGERQSDDPLKKEVSFWQVIGNFCVGTLHAAESAEDVPVIYVDKSGDSHDSSASSDAEDISDEVHDGNVYEPED